MNWQRRSLGECCKFSSGGTPNKGKAEYWNGEIPWVSSGEMGRHFIGDTKLHISEEGAQAGSRLVSAGTIFAVVRGMSLATEFRVSYATRAMAFNQDVKAIVANDGVDSYFLFSTLRAHAAEIRDLATEAAHGTKKLEMERLEAFQIGIPRMGVQLEVASVVRAYDDLIETNRRRIALLEESARLLYREWFVKLRFPGSTAVLGKTELPEGWEMRSLSEVAEVNRASLSSKSMVDEIQYVDIASVETGAVVWGARMRYAEAPGRARRLVQHGDVIWSCVRPNRRSFALLWEPDSDVVVSTGFAVLTASSVPFSYLYFATTSDDFVAYLTNRATGAAYPAVTAKDFEEAPLLYPSQQVLQDFHERCLPLLELRNTLTKQNVQLIAARDALLPKLMSGEIQI